MTSKMQRRGPGSQAGGNHPTRLELLDAATHLAGAEGLDALVCATEDVRDRPKVSNDAEPSTDKCNSAARGWPVGIIQA